MKKLKDKKGIALMPLIIIIAVLLIFSSVMPIISNAANTDEIVRLATKMFENYETYHDYAYLNQQEIKKFDVSTMVAQYIKNMENIK